MDAISAGGAATNDGETLSVRDRLLNAAERVVGRDGLRNFTLGAVAHEAGVSKGGLLYHFPSKSALITAIVERLASQCDANQRQALADVPDRPGAFTRAYVAVRTDPRDTDKAPVHTAILAAAGTNPRFLDPFRTKFLDWQARLEADGIEPEVATIVRLAVDGLCLCRLLGMPAPEGQLLNSVIERLIAMTERKEEDRAQDPSHNGEIQG